MSEEKPCHHCWHDNGYILTSYPPQYPQTCCKCGEKRTIRGASFEVNPAEHGQFLLQNRGI